MGSGARLAALLVGAALLFGSAAACTEMPRCKTGDPACDFSSALLYVVEAPVATAAAPTVPALGRIAFADVGTTKRIQTMLPDGSDLQTPVSLTGAVDGFKVEQGRQRYIYTQPSGNAVFHAPIAGGAPATLLTDAATPFGVALDETNDRVYYVNQTNREVRSASLADGTGNTLIRTLAGTSGDVPLEYDPRSGLIYAAQDTNTIVRFPADGSSVVETLSTTPVRVVELKIDFLNDRLYVTDFDGSVVLRMNLDGTSETVVVSAGSQPGGVALDPVNDRMFYCLPLAAPPLIVQSDLAGANQTTIRTFGAGETPVTCSRINAP